MNSNRENRMVAGAGCAHAALALLRWRRACRGAWRRTRSSRSPARSRRGTEVVRIELSEPLAAVPAGFAIQTPPRIALDLPGVTQRARPQVSVEVNQGNLRSVNVAQSGDRTRLVLNLKTAAELPRAAAGQVAAGRRSTRAPRAGARPQRRRRSRRALRREPQPRRRCRCATSTSAAAPTAPAASSSTCRATRSASTSASRARTWSSNSCSSIAARQACAAASTSTDFGTPVQTRHHARRRRPRAHGRSSRRAWEHSAYQSDNQFVSRCDRRRSTRTSWRRAPGYTGEKLSLNFQNIEVRALLQVIADFTNFNIVTSDTVTGNVTLRLKDVPWDQALDIILQAKGLGMRKTGNVLLDRAEGRDRRQGEARARGASRRSPSLEPLRTQSFQLNYTKADDIAKALTGQRAGAAAAPARILSHARQRDRRAAHQPAVRHRHPVAARGGAGADRQARHRRCARC